MRRTIGLLLLAVVGSMLFVLFAGDDDPAKVAPAVDEREDVAHETPAEPAESENEPDSRPIETQVAADDTPLPVAPAQLVGRVFDLKGGSLQTSTFEGAQVEVWRAETTFEVRMADDELRGLDLMDSSRQVSSLVRTSFADRPPDHVTSTDEEGRFVVEGLLVNAWHSIRVHAPGYVPFQHRSLYPAPGERRDLGRIDLYFGGIVAGAVLDEHERSVPGADVLLGGERVATSDDAGRYEVGGLRTGVITLRARGAGQLSSLAPTREVMVQTNNRLDNVTLSLPVGVVARGTVVDQLGAPLPRARVDAVVNPDGGGIPTTAATLTDDEGRFRFPGLPAASTLTVAANHPFAREEIVRENVDPSRSIDVVLERFPLLVVETSVSDGGRVTPDRLTWKQITVGTIEGRDVEAHAIGDLRIGLPIRETGDLAVTASKPGYSSATETKLRPGVGDVGPVKLELKDRPRITGQVVAAGGGPVARARVTLFDSDRPMGATITRSDGMFAVDAGRATHVIVSAEGFALRRASILFPPLQVVLVPERRIRGVVTGFDGEPAAGFGLLVHGPLGESDQSVRTVRTNVKGEFVAKQLRPGRYRVHVAACATLEPASRLPELLVFSDVRHDIDLRLGYGTLRGEVFIDHILAEGVELELRRSKWGRSLGRMSVTTAPGGAYRFPILPADRFELIASRDGQPLDAPTPVTIRGGSHLELPIIVRPGSVGGVVDRPPPTGATVSLVAAVDERERKVRAGLDGAFRFIDVAAGHYLLSADAPGRVTPPVALEVKPSGHLEVRLTLEPATFAVFVADDAESWRIAKVEVTTRGGPTATAPNWRRRDGTVVVPGLPVGEAKFAVLLEANVDRDWSDQREFLRAHGGRLELTATVDADLTEDGPNRYTLVTSKK